MTSCKHTGVVFSHRKVLKVVYRVCWHILSIIIHHKTAAIHNTSVKHLTVLKYLSDCSIRVYWSVSPAHTLAIQSSTTVCTENQSSVPYNSSLFPIHALILSSACLKNILKRNDNPEGLEPPQTPLATGLIWWNKQIWSNNAGWGKWSLKQSLPSYTLAASPSTKHSQK